MEFRNMYEEQTTTVTCWRALQPLQKEYGGKRMGEEVEQTCRISYEIIKDIAPKELPFFDDFRERFVKNPDAFTERNREKKEKMLGFALPDPTSTIQLLTTFVLPIVLAVIKKYPTKKEGKTLGVDQLKEVKTEALKTAADLGINEDKAEVIADAIVGKLTTSGVQ